MSSLTGDGTGGEADHAAVLAIHEAEAARVAVRLGPGAVGVAAPRSSATRQRRRYHELRALRIEPAPVA